MPIVRWLDQERRAGRTPHLHAYTSAIVRLCQASRDAAAISPASGSPSAWESPPRRPADDIGPRGLRRGRATPGSSAGRSASGVYPAAADDLHFFHDRLAVIQPGPDTPPAGLPADALLFTGLRRGRRPSPCSTSRWATARSSRSGRAGVPWAPWDDSPPRRGPQLREADVGRHDVLDADVVRILEEVLPARFGGGPGDYQLMEDEAANGQPRLTLLLHPGSGSRSRGSRASVPRCRCRGTVGASHEPGVADGGLLRSSAGRRSRPRPARSSTSTSPLGAPGPRGRTGDGSPRRPRRHRGPIPAAGPAKDAAASAVP